MSLSLSWMKKSIKEGTDMHFPPELLFLLIGINESYKLQCRLEEIKEVIGKIDQKMESKGKK